MGSRRFYTFVVLVSGVVVTALTAVGIFQPRQGLISSPENIPSTLGLFDFLASSNCSEPTAGCGTDHYWDSDSCSCYYVSSSSSTSGCSEPTAGCGGGFYWDLNSCSCQKDDTVTNSQDSESASSLSAWPSPTPIDYQDYQGDSRGGYRGGYFYDSGKHPNGQEEGIEGGDKGFPVGVGGQDQSGTTSDKSQNTYDRFAYESQEKISCIKAKLTSDEYKKLRYFLPTNQDGYDELGKLERKVKFCFERLSEDQKEDTGFSEDKTPVESEGCLIDGIGSFAHRAIYLGAREPTFEEQLWFEKCYEGKEKRGVVFQTANKDLPNQVHQCLKLTVGKTLYEKIESGVGEVPVNLRDKVEACFGASPQPFKEGSVFKAPQELKSCLEQRVGSERFAEINRGTSEPTDDERQKGEVCFDLLNEVQSNFLPPLPEQVPYLKPEPETIDFSGIKQLTKEIDDKTFGGKIIFSGKALPNSTVNIYIFSEPIVVTTKTDENGDWIYELSQPLEGEKHVAYATIKSETGQTVRSTVFDFTLVAAESPLGKTFIKEDEVIMAQSSFLKGVLVSMSISVLIVGGMIYFSLRKREYAKEGERKTKLIHRLERQGKGDSGTGTVN